MAAGGINDQRAEMRTAIGPGTANYARLKGHDLLKQTTYAAHLKTITDKNINDWTDQETAWVASMFTVAVYC